jgi:hypothetical protein
LFFAAFLHVECGEHKMSFEERPDRLRVEEGVEATAPTAPRRAEVEEDRFVLGGGPGLGGRQHLAGARCRLSCDSDCPEQENRDSKQGNAHRQQMRPARRRDKANRARAGRRGASLS